MTPTPAQKMTPPSLNELLVAYVNRPVDAASIEAEAGALGEVEPHEVAVGFRVDPRLAWREGSSALEMFGLPVPKATAPTEWGALVVRHEAIAAQPYAIGNYPQRVRDLTGLLQAKDLGAFRPKNEAHAASTALRNWASKQASGDDQPSRLLAAAVLRTAGDYSAATSTLDQAEKTDCANNERAALLWQHGEWEQAAAIWDKLPDSTIAWFNRGMAALFLKQPAKAREYLKKAIEQLPEANGWHHLASLYLALTEIRQ